MLTKWRNSNLGMRSLGMALHFLGFRNVPCETPPSRQKCILTICPRALRRNWLYERNTGIPSKRIVINVVNFPGGKARNYTMADWIFQFADEVSYHHSSNSVNSSSPWQNGRHFADDIFKRICLYEEVRILIKISLKFVLRDQFTITRHWFRWWLCTE